MRRQQKPTEEATRVLTSKLQRTAAEDEVPKKLGMGPDRWHKVRLDYQTMIVMSVPGCFADHPQLLLYHVACSARFWLGVKESYLTFSLFASLS